MLLSDRMLAVVGLVEPCKSIADIGCDHGYVAMELVQRNICGHVIAMDINKGPLDRARHNIKEYGMQDFIETRLSDGTKSLKADEAEGIICAGMGGKLVISILEQGKELVNNMKQVILQPQSEIDEVRSYLRENGFLIEKEDMVCEDGKYYPMMRAIPACRQSLRVPQVSEDEAVKLARVSDTYGPCLLEMSHPVLKSYLLRQKENLGNIKENLLSQENATERQQCRLAELDEKISDILFCLDNYFV